MSLSVKQRTDYNSDGLWSWSVWIDGADSEIDTIKEVVYVLDSSYARPVRRVNERNTKFRLDAEGWSSFVLSIEIYFKDGNKKNIKHDLDLEDNVRNERPGETKSLQLERRIQSSGPKKLLSLDGGGVRSVITIQILEHIENILRDEYSQPDLVLSDYFDYVSGTSTGAIIACGLSLGMSAREVREFFTDLGPSMFEKASLLRRLRYKFEDEPLASRLKECFGIDTTLGSQRLRTLLMVVVRNATTDEPWPLSNNPHAKYNDKGRLDSNLRIPLWQIVRASTAAPTYYPPEVVRIGARDFVFVDGGVSSYYNPSMLLFLMATAEPYKLQWPVGETNMLLVSVGSGDLPRARNDVQPDEMNLLYNATTVPSAVMRSAKTQQDLLCRMFGTCVVGPLIDREVGDMVGLRGPGAQGLFTYVRYEPALDAPGLDSLGVSELGSRQLTALDNPANIPDLQLVGRLFSERTVRATHFQGFLHSL